MKTTILCDMTLCSLADVKNTNISQHPQDCMLQHLLANLSN